MPGPRERHIMDDQPTRATTAATAEMFDLIEADLLRILRRRARLGDLRPPEPGRPRAPQQARQPVAGGPVRRLATVIRHPPPAGSRDRRLRSVGIADRAPTLVRHNQDLFPNERVRRGAPHTLQGPGHASYVVDRH